MKLLKITVALVLLFIVITSFTEKEKTNTLQISTPKQVFYTNGIAQD